MICVRNLTKKFDDFYAVKKLSFDIDTGEIFGFIGPNGAGKTTTILMMATLLEPDDGSAWIDGDCIRLHQGKVRKSIGYMPDYYGVYEGVTVWEYLDFFARAYRLPAKSRNRIIQDCMELTDFGKLTNKLVSSLSKGMKQRLCLAKTLLHDPKVLILDEPAAGLDPRARIEIRSLLKELSNMGKTIFISSHILTELSDIVTSIGIIEKGQLIASGSPDDISNALNSSQVHKLSFTLFNLESIEKATGVLQEIPDISEINAEEKCIEVDYKGKEENIYLILKKLVQENIPIVEMKKTQKNLEEIFMDVTRGEVS